MNDPMKNQEATVPSTDTDAQRGLFPELTELMRAAVADADLHSFEIPSLDLYIDQILTLVSEKNETAGARYRENVLTKTMVNNYSKEGLISSIKGKKYTKEQILQILLICSLKNTVSISDVKRILQGVYGEGFNGSALEESYERYLAIKAKNRDRAMLAAETLMQKEGLTLTDSRDYFVGLLGLLSLSVYLKNIALVMMEARYPDPAAREEEKARTAKEAREREKEDKEKDKDKDKEKEKDKKGKAGESGNVRKQSK